MSAQEVSIIFAMLNWGKKILKSLNTIPHGEMAEFSFRTRNLHDEPWTTCFARKLSQTS